MKWTLFILILLYSLTTEAQHLYRDSVHYSLPQYRAQRNWCIAAKTTMALQDSTISSQDSIISVMGRRIASRDTLLSKKDSTIKNISNLVPKAIDGEKFWRPFKKGVGVGAIVTALGIAVVKVVFSNKY